MRKSDMQPGSEDEGVAWQIGVWDRMAQSYEQEVDRRFTSVVDGVVRRAALHAGEQVLDLGTGTGAVAVRAASLVGAAPEVYVEVPLDDAVEERLDALAARGLRAKVRCGATMVPSVAQLARFVRACSERGLVFKATAGLHHAIRRDGEHGFLNLLAAVVFGDEEEALGERDRAAFALTAEAFAWRDRSAGPEELAAARRDRLPSIGSCSFFEPVEELEALGVLPL